MLIQVLVTLLICKGLADANLFCLLFFLLTVGYFVGSCNWFIHTDIDVCGDYLTFTS